VYAISNDIRRTSATLVELSVVAGVAVTQVAARYAMSRHSVHSWVRKYEQSGPARAGGVVGVGFGCATTLLLEDRLAEYIKTAWQQEQSARCIPLPTA
jgi:transposase-like protein